MSFTLRRSQSLKSLSGGHSSWSTSEVLFWDRRTPVSQLVERYESCVDLTDVDREEACSKSSDLRRSNHEESKVENLWRRYESLSGTNNALSRSISMDMLPQPDLVGPNAQRVLFESKKYTSSPRLNVTPQTKSSPVSHSTSQWREAPTGWEKVYSGATTVTNAKKDKAHQKEKSFNETMRRRTISGVPGYVTRSSTGLNDKKHFKKDRESASYQDHKPKNTYSPIPSVKDRSVLYLSKVAAADSSGYIEHQGSVFQEHLISSGKKKKQSKLLSPAKEMCSACLMPVYPVEKMVADKLILHINCFCCKHCNKKLSIYNYSALYGEFYCPSHYHQLFKKKGNYDEGFGHRQHKDRWLVKTEEPKPTNKFSSARKTEPTCVDATVDDPRGPSSRQQRHKDDQFKCPDNTNKLRINWPPENKGTRHSPVSQNTSSASSRTTDWSNHKRSGSRSSRNALEKKRFNSGLDEMDKSVQRSPRVYEKTNTYVSPFTIKSAPHSEDVYTPHPRGSKTLQKTADRSGTQSKVSTGGKVTGKYINSVTSRPDSLREHNLAEDGKADSPTKIKKSVRFVSNLDIDEENNTEISCEEVESFTDAFIEPAAVNGSVMTAATFESGTEIEESPVEGLIDKMHHPYSHDSVEHTKALDGQMQVPFLLAVGNEEIEKTKANEANMSEIETMLNLDELQINDIPACGKEKFKPGSESCDLEQVDEMKKEVVIESNAKAVTSKNQEPTDIIKVESKVPDLLDMPPISNNKSNTKVADKKATDKGNKGSWSKGKSPLSKLFTSGPNSKENKSETKMESKRPRNLLGRLFSSSEIDLEIKKTPEIKPETTCKKEPEKPGVIEDDTALIQENISVSPPSTEPTCQNTPQEPIKPTQNQLSDAAEEPNLIEGLENPILLPNGSSADETVPSINLESLEQHKPTSVGFGETDINEALIPSQEHIHVDMTSLDSSKPSSLEESLNSSLPQNEDTTGFLDSSDAFTSQVTGPNTDAMVFSGSDTLDYTHSDPLTDYMDLETPSVDIGSSFIQEDPFGEKAQGESGDMTSSPVNFNQKTLDIFGTSESNIEANSYGFANTLTEANKNEAGVSSEMTDDPFGMNNAPLQTMDIFGGDNMLTVFDQSSTNNFFDIMTNSETQSQNPFEGITDGQLAPTGVFDFISSEGDPSPLSVTSNVFEQKSSDLEQGNQIQSEVNNVFDSKGNQSTSHVPDQNLSGQELIKSSQIEAFDFFSSEKDPSTAAFSHMSADPFPNDIFASVIDSTDTNTFSMETTQRTANPFDDFTGLESHGEAAETKACNLFPDDIFSSVPAMSPEPAQDTSSIADPRNPDTNAVLQQKPENDWMSDFLG